MADETQPTPEQHIEHVDQHVDVLEQHADAPTDSKADTAPAETQPTPEPPTNDAPAEQAAPQPAATPEAAPAGTVPPDQPQDEKSDEPKEGPTPEGSFPAKDELADPRKPIDELPPGVIVGGAPVAHVDDRPEDKPVDGPAPGTETGKAQPIRVDNHYVRSDDDALEGHFVKVVAGDHKDQVAAFVAALDHDPDSGYPRKALLRFKDTTYSKEYDVVPYEDIAPQNTYLG